VQEPPAIYLVSGRGPELSAVARQLASRFPRGVHLQAAGFLDWIVRGREQLDTPGLQEQLAATAADTYSQAGFTVVVESGPVEHDLGDFRMLIRGRPCHVVVLQPAAEAGAAPRVGIWVDPGGASPDEIVEEILRRTAADAEPVVVVEYDSQWPARFDELAAPVRDVVSGLGASVEHVGSTAVPGLAAKPIIDIDLVVQSAGDVPTAIERLRGLGYVYQGDKGIRGREAFMWPPGAPRHHLYVVVAGSQPHSDHVRFRDHLRRHPKVAARYAALKTDLAARYGDDRLGYTTAKTAFISQVMRDASA
jgi:GrpB-like predicted nucleotidyltransferase (UPF0157 family)